LGQRGQEGSGASDRSGDGRDSQGRPKKVSPTAYTVRRQGASSDAIRLASRPRKRLAQMEKFKHNEGGRGKMMGV